MNKHGLLTCTRYAFPPNQLKYCGPDNAETILQYQKEQTADQGLAEIIEEFSTLYPYLTLIAHENNIRDPFDPRVVEAYWIGNRLLENVSMKEFYKHVAHALGLKQKIKKKEFDYLIGKIPQGALPHHAFHVFNVFTRTGHHTVHHTLETMDECRIGWGKIVMQNSKSQMLNNKTRHSEFISESITVLSHPLILKKGKLALGKPIEKIIHFPPDLSPNHLKPNIYVSFHWSTFCDILTREQVDSLEKYTKQAIALANETI